ncbi:hypothetical protein [Paraliomyxa miuraensis]|uniref:hypothetical protein n=1 Tax=Paraliomyxa miuraensis TaxID=376150 RepID=UPI002258BC7E|nr:hypothetical protein [Paraliomyxa miuraensis]MCX4241758.1 hypothetical protein [Paraliomyxa miuraensis]
MVLVLSLWPSPSHAHWILAASPSAQRAEKLLKEGDTAREQGNYREAADRYSAAYYSLPLADRVSYVGALAVRNAMTAFELLHDENPDPLVLERQTVFVDEFLASVAAQEGGADQVGASVIEELQQARSRAEDKQPPTPKPKKTTPKECPATPTPVPDEVSSSGSSTDGNHANGTPEPTQPPPPNAKHRPSWLGVGLAVGGGITAAAGAGVLTGWWTVRREASAFADLTPGMEEGTEARAAYLAQQEDKAQRFRITGAVLVSVGAAAATAGAVLLALNRKGHAPSKGVEARTTVVPHFDRHGAGVALSRRF